jgi:glutamine---fructose-6-phosphate transaminase (isomerizing)
VPLSTSAAGPVPGRLRDEIREQPEVAARLLRGAGPVVRAVADAVRREGIGLVVIAARGTSDHAAVYAQYVLGARNGLTIALAAPSLVTL